MLPYYMVGDDIFQLKDYLMRPYPRKRSGKLPIDQAVFNYRLSRARRVIENSLAFLLLDGDCFVNLFMLIKKILRVMY